MHDLAEKVFWSSILPSTSRFDVQFLSDDLSCFQFDRCKLHARGHVQHEYKLAYAFANLTVAPASTVAPVMSSAVLLGCDIGGRVDYRRYRHVGKRQWRSTAQASWRKTFSVRKPSMALLNLLTAVFVGWASIVIFF